LPFPSARHIKMLRFSLFCSRRDLRTVTNSLGIGGDAGGPHADNGAGVCLDTCACSRILRDALPLQCTSCARGCRGGEEQNCRQAAQECLLINIGCDVMLDR
jgi:hypothetical protein